MAKNAAAKIVGASCCDDQTPQRGVPTKLKPSSLLDTRVVYCGDNLEQLAKLPDAHNSALRTSQSAIAMTGSFYYHCDWHASQYVNALLN